VAAAKAAMTAPMPLVAILNRGRTRCSVDTEAPGCHAKRSMHALLGQHFRRGIASDIGQMGQKTDMRTRMTVLPGPLRAQALMPWSSIPPSRCPSGLVFPYPDVPSPRCPRANNRPERGSFRECLPKTPSGQHEQGREERLGAGNFRLPQMGKVNIKPLRLGREGESGQ
jgi:hypothetical protein